MSNQDPSAIRFSDLNIIEPLLKALNDVGYEIPTPIQVKTIPPLLAGKDVLGQAQTGTGKTAAFALPILSRIDLSKSVPQVLVLTPTRELSIQVAEAFQRYAAHLKGFHVLPIYGGQNYSGQFRQLKRGAHVVVGTPGRVMDHMRRGTLDLSSLECLVLDEADEMLRMGFIDDVEWVLEQTPPERQIALFSATMPKEINKIARRYLNEPEEVLLEVRSTSANTIRQRYWMVSGLHKLDALTRILEGEPFDGMIVFVRTKVSTVELAEKLESRGFASAALNGDISQNVRERTVEGFKAGKFDILVATDVAARGLDVDRISHVINYDVPYDTEAYIHRIGRTGRAGRSGEAILFATPRERRLLRAIEKATNQKIGLMELPAAEEINDKRIASFKERITDTLAMEELGIFYQLVEEYRQEHNVPAIEIAAALAKIVQGDKPLLLANKPNPKPVGFDDAPPERNESRKRKKKHVRPLEEGKTRYRLEAGYNHGVKPGNIVGAIANEAGIDSMHIGRIELYDDYSTVDLPAEMPGEIMRILKRLRIAGHKLNITEIDSDKMDRAGKSGPDKKKFSFSGKDKKNKHKKKKKSKQRVQKND